MLRAEPLSVCAAAAAEVDDAVPARSSNQGGLTQEQLEDFPLEAGIAKRHANKMPLVDNLRLLRAPAGGEQG